MRKYAFSFVVLLLMACGDDYLPKPMGYFRIGLPTKEYAPLENDCNFTFKLNTQAQYNPVKNKDCWADIYYPKLKATVQLTYYSFNDKKLETLLQETQRMAYSHTAIADGMQEKLFVNEEKRVFGLLYTMKGQVATSTQFYMTDSTNNFLRGVLYFYSSPNPDSLKTVNDFMRGEIIELIESLEWKNG